MLQTDGTNELWVIGLEDGEIGEEQAVGEVANKIGSGSVEFQLTPGGRANLFATEPCCVLVDNELLNRINCRASLVIATSLNFSYARARQRLATVKSLPFAVTRAQLDSVIAVLNENGPILHARPIRNPSVGILYTGPLAVYRDRHLFENIMLQRLKRFGETTNVVLADLENEADVSRSLQQLLQAKPTCVLIASATVPAGPDDVVGRAMVSAGCSIERFLAPVEPGNLLLLGYRDEIPVVSAPGCFRSAKPNVVDLILPPILAQYRVSGREIAGLGHGGLLPYAAHYKRATKHATAA
jgi:molybdenum cofactor cytidylyltransferase